MDGIFSTKQTVLTILKVMVILLTTENVRMPPAVSMFVDQGGHMRDVVHVVHLSGMDFSVGHLLHLTQLLNNHVLEIYLSSTTEVRFIRCLSKLLQGANLSDLSLCQSEHKSDWKNKD